jgi:hypothetical protein
VFVFLVGCKFDPATFAPSTPADGRVVDVPEATDDAPAPDAPPPDAALVCPSSYQPVANAPGRYRHLTTAKAFRPQHDDCKDDQAGATHLVVLETAAERSALHVAFAPAGSFWVGTVQLRNQTIDDANWFYITGAPFDALQWAGIEPNDDDNVENGEQNFGESFPDGLDDEFENTQLPAICECDGIPIDTNIESGV